MEYTVQEETMQAIADAIRERSETSDPILTSDMPSLILTLKAKWGEITGDIKDQVDLNELFAKVNGYYEDMSVGSAEQLLSNIFETDKSPYLFRTSGGSLEIGDREYPTIVGASVAWNQKISSSLLKSASDYGITVTKNQDGTLTITGKSTAYSSINISDYFLMTQNNKYFMYSKGLNDNIHMFDGYSADGYCKGNGLILNWGRASGQANLFLRIVYDTECNTTIQPMLVNLTLMFGSTIADYVYTLEQSEAGSGIAWLKANGYFLKDYYPYNAGGIESVKTSAHKTTGFNQFNKSTATLNRKINNDGTSTMSDANCAYSGYIPALPDTVYYVSNTSVSTYASVFANYDADKSFLGWSEAYSGSSKLRKTLPNTKYIRLNMLNTVVDTLNVNLHWDGEKDGEYEAYEEHTYPLDSDLELRGVYKLDTNNKLYTDGDVYESDGMVTRRYGIVDLGTLTWTKNATYQSNWRFTASLSGVKRSADATSIPNIVCSKYQANSPQATYLGYSGISINNTSDSIEVCDLSYSDAATFKTTMNGVYLVYELATPTTESADPYTNPQIVDNWGTEEFVDERTVPIPVGHETKYIPDLKAKIESAPNNPSTNGLYFLQYENGEATYVPVPSEVPQTPSEDGTYVLKATVASGVATLSWVAEE